MTYSTIHICSRSHILNNIIHVVWLKLIVKFRRHHWTKLKHSSSKQVAVITKGTSKTHYRNNNSKYSRTNATKIIKVQTEMLIHFIRCFQNDLLSSLHVFYSFFDSLFFDWSIWLLMMIILLFVLMQILFWAEALHICVSIIILFINN